MKLVGSPKFGPVHRFGDYHVYRVLSILSDRKRRGRKALAELVGIGEGSMRTILAWMKGKGLVSIKQTGVRITSSGLDFLNTLPLRLRDIGMSDISIGNCSAAALVKERASRIGTGIEQRDAAIKAGAEGATTIVVKGRRLVVPTDYDLDKEKPELARSLRQLFDLEEGDVVIVGTASSRQNAEQGALAAAFELL